MKIAVWHNLPSGGGKRALVDQVDALVQRGHRVTVWTNPSAHAEPPDFASGVEIRLADLRIAPQPRGGALPPWPLLQSRYAAMGQHLDRVASEIATEQCDVLFGGACRYFRVVDLPSRLSMPSVLYLGEPYRWLYEALPTLPWSLEPRGQQESLWRWMGRRARDSATIPGLRRMVARERASAASWGTILVNSLFSRESITRVYGLPASVSYLGIDPGRLRATLRDRERFVLCVGALVPEKGAERAIRVVAGLSEPRPPLVWVANVASEEHLSWVRRAARDRGVEFRPRINVPDAELANLYATASALLYVPTLEPFGLVPLEASAAGLPVVGIAEGGVRETVLDGINGLLGFDESHLASALQRVLDDPEVWMQLSEAGPTLVQERWRLDIAVDRLEGHLRHAVELGR